MANHTFKQDITFVFHSNIVCLGPSGVLDTIYAQVVDS